MNPFIYLLAGAALLSSVNAVATPDAPKEFEALLGPCAPAKPRFPERYAALGNLKNASAKARIHTVPLLAKDPQAGLFVEATLEEIDLDQDGVCDLVATVRDPIGTGGDSDVLGTIYLARPGQPWKRVGAASAGPGDLPSSLDLVKFPADAAYVFSEFAAIRGVSGSRRYLVTWNHERVANGTAGYAVYELDVRKGLLHPLDKRKAPGAQVYAFFKTLRNADGVALFDPRLEVE